MDTRGKQAKDGNTIRLVVESGHLNEKEWLPQASFQGEEQWLKGESGWLKGGSDDDRDVIFCLNIRTRLVDNDDDTSDDDYAC